jgi:ubiquitin-protein ligase
MEDPLYWLQLPQPKPKLLDFAQLLQSLPPSEDDEYDDDLEYEYDDDEYDDDDLDLDEYEYDLEGDLLEQHLTKLSKYYPLWLDDDYRFVIVQDVLLPPDFNYEYTDFLIEIPPDYPLSPPGIGNYRIYTHFDLHFRGRSLRDLHLGTTPKVAVQDPNQWAWFCYQQIDWNPLTDDLCVFLEMVRADLTDPPTH